MEKSSQVQMMGSIFGQATEVLVWLGEERDDSSLAIMNLKTISQIVSTRGMSAVDMLRLWEIEEALTPKMIKEIVESNTLNPEFVDSIIKLLERPWWKRVWVIQQLILARKAAISCGSVKLSWLYYDHELSNTALFRR